MNKSNFKIFLIEDNGSYAELDCDDLDFTTTFSITDVTDISTRKDTISKNITLKATKNNNNVFGSLYSLSRFADTSLPEVLYYNYSPNKSVKCQIYENNTMLFKGDFKIIEVNKDVQGNFTYEALVIGSLVNLFSAIGDDLLTDLDGFDDSHNYDYSTVSQSWFVNSLSGYDFVYPSIDYGADSGNTLSQKFNFKNFRAGIYLSKYLNAIFNTYGYTLSGNFINSAILQRAYIPYTEQTYQKNVFEPIGIVSASTSSYSFSNDAPTARGKYISVRLDAGNSGTTLNKITVTANGNSIEAYVFNRSVTTGGIFNINFTSTLTSGLRGSFSVNIFAYENGSVNVLKPISSKQYLLNSTSNTVADNITFNIPYKSYSPNEGFAIFFGFSKVVSTEATSFVNVNVSSALLQLGNNLQESVVELRLNDVVRLKDILPQNIKVKDFLKSILQFFNLYLIQNPDNDRDWIVEPFDLFYKLSNQPSLNALNWSDKLDNGSNIKLSYNNQLPKYYNFKFKEDSDFYNELYKTKYKDTYGNYTFNNKFGSADDKNIEVTFSPTVIVKENLDDKIMPSIFKGELTNKESFKSNIRILFNNGIDTCNFYDIVNVTGNTEYIINPDVPYYNASSHLLISGATTLFNLQFGLPKEVFFNIPSGDTIFNLPTLFTTFYENQLLELNDDNVANYEADVLLNEVDISNLDLRRPVYLQNEFGSSYFKILSVNYSGSKETSDVKLQKIVN